MSAWGGPGTRWVVETSSGSRHLFAFDNDTTYLRLPDETNTSPDPQDPDRYWSEGLRRDGEVLAVIGNLPEPVVGQRHSFWITGLNPAAAGTLRDTTPVVAVSLLSSEGNPDAAPSEAQSRPLHEMILTGLDGQCTRRACGEAWPCALAPEEG